MKMLYSTEMYFLSNKVRYLITTVLFIVAILVIASYIVDIKEPWFNKPSLAVVIIVVILIIILMAVAMFLTIHLEIYSTEIHIRTISTKKIKKKEIEKVEIREVDPIKDYGGWGYRTVKGERAFITGETNRGVHITVKGGPNLFIASKDADRIVRALKG